MPWGLRIRDAAGNIVLDTNDRVFTIIGTFSHTFSNQTTSQSGSFSVPDSTRGTPAYIIIEFPMQYGTGDGDFEAMVDISFSGTTCNWTVNVLAGTLGTSKLVFHYGYY